jgi:MoaA/NifB/PqqE/SkfB family radical SAM enzyme
MSFGKTFCSSPWFHMRINNSGTYEYCRWQVHDPSRVNFDRNIKSQAPQDYFQNSMSAIRGQLLNGEIPSGCRECHVMENSGKVSGRQRQLLKTGIREPYFEKTLASSLLRKDFDHSFQNQGHTTRHVTDWQIDLGNFCNGGCVFCNPESSSRLASEFKKLNLIDQVPPNSWCDNPDLLDKFVQDLINAENLKYLHFLGGETLITPAFKTILRALIDHPQLKNITIGLTTNLNVWPQDVVDLLCQFDNVNLGMSVETLTPINDYVRWPNTQQRTMQLLTQWIELADKKQWLTQLRVTPTCLTIHDIVSVYDYAWNQGISVESCNFLYNPSFLKIDVLPQQFKIEAKQTIQQWLDSHPINIAEQIINTRNPDFYRVQIWQDLNSYVNYLDSSPDQSDQLPDLVNYLKLLESNRGNSIIEYLPQYEQLFRSAGY